MNPHTPPSTHAAERAPLVGPIAALDEESLVAATDDTQAAAQAQGTTEWLGVRVGQIGLLLPTTAARELLDPPPAARLPHTPAWFTGLANVRGALVPMVDTARALDVEHDSTARRYLLIFNHGDQTIGLIVDGLPRRQVFEARERTNSLPPHPVLLDGHLTGAYDRDGLLWFELDLDGFFRTLGARIGQA